MSKGRLSGDGRQTRQSTLKKKNQKKKSAKASLKSIAKSPVKTTFKNTARIVAKSTGAAKITAPKKVAARKTLAKKEDAESSHAGPVHRFIGISLSGGKADKACMAIVEYFPSIKKFFYLD